MIRRIGRHAGLLIAVCALFASCIKAGDVQVLGIEGVSVQSLSRTDIALQVENRSSHKLTLREGRLRVNVKGSPFAEVMLREPVLVGKRSQGTVNVPLQVRMTNPLMMLSMMAGPPADPSQITLSGELSLKGGCLKKKFRVEEMTLSDFIRTFGGNEQQLVKFLQQWQSGL
ncbi:MAG: hypothetical protein IJC16_03315 [Rikenellaceae bacterium]|nr:hypothetical protein [Rikenellaceae bacterium]